MAFAEAVYAGSMVVEGVEAVLAENTEQALQLLKTGRIPVLVDPQAAVASQIKPVAFIDAVMAKRNTGTKINDAPLVVGLGPGFTAGVDVHAVVEKEGHNRPGFISRKLLQTQVCLVRLWALRLKGF